MNVYLIDAENVNLELFIKSREFSKGDKFYLVGYTSLKFSIEVLKFLQDREYFVYNFSLPSENYADKIIFTILGYIISVANFSSYYIVSNDSIFENLAYTEKLFGKKVVNIKFSNSKALVSVEKSRNLTDDKSDIEKIYSDFKAEIENLRKTNKNSVDFHNALVKKFGMEVGKRLYKLAKPDQNSQISKIETNCCVCV